MKQRIVSAQIDPNGLCNAGCWFCPVASEPNPERARRAMPPELFERILGELVAARGGIVDPAFRHVYTAHYNEVLLYPHLPALLGALRKHRLGTTVLTNGSPLSRAKVELLAAHQDVVWAICVNLPTIDPALWTAFTGLSPRLLSTTLDQLDHLLDALPDLAPAGRLTIQVNGVDARSLHTNGGPVELGGRAPTLDLDPVRGTLAQQRARIEARFPGVPVHVNPHLSDRAGHLERLAVLSNRRSVDARSERGRLRVVGCGNMEGGRPEGWLHVNAAGDVFLCCNDYHFEYRFGNLAEQSLAEVWESPRRREVIAAAYAGICARCDCAVWG